jgi:hypothetical protein
MKAGAIAILSLAVCGAVVAQPVTYTWTGMGTVVPGSSKCQTYRMSASMTVNGNDVTGVFRQQGREERNFTGTKDANGVVRTKAVVGGEGTLDVTITFRGNDARILMDGYCKFEGRLTPQ